MQPLYSVDHESRHNSNHVEAGQEPLAPSEDTPLLQRFPQYVHPRNPATAFIVSLLIIILIAGIIIGIYLLVLQSNSENILPPIDVPLQLVSRTQWDHRNGTHRAKMLSPLGLKQVMVVHTNTQQCQSTETCTKLLQEMQANITAVGDVIPYNFLISSNGQTYEGLGWHRSPLKPKQQPSNGVVVAFIGNFSQVPPTQSQMEETKNFFDYYVSQKHLHPSFRIIGKNVNDTPIHLSESLKRYPQWSGEFSDTKNI